MYYTKTKQEIFKEFNSNIEGLSSSQAKTRLEKYGPNILKQGKKISALQIFISQFKSFLVYILIAAVIISTLLHEYIDAVVIAIILVLNAIMGFVQEYNAEKSIEALKKLTSLKAKVLRDGKETEIPTEEVVVGDIVLLEEGDKIPADARVIESINLETAEASLTGESTPVEKKDSVLSDGSAIGDQKNMVFSSTIITKGRGKGIVCATAMKTEIGKIAKMIQEADDGPTPLQLKLKRLGERLGMLTIAICLVVFIAGSLRTGQYAEMFLASIALAVAAIPEGLPAVVTISLGLGVQRMVKRNALVRKLPSVETLGSTTVICSDKTGTLTKNQMTVTKLYANNEEIEVTGRGYDFTGSFSKDPKNFELLLKIGLLCNNSNLEDNNVIGDPTEGSLIVSAAKAKLDKEKVSKEFARIKEIPFDSDRKLMTTVHIDNKKYVAYTKGAPDNIINKCNKIYKKGKISVMTKEDRDNIIRANDTFANSALRVLGFAFKEVATPKDANEKDMVFVGLQGMIDPAREEVKGAIVKCKEAGIKVIMITGDHKLTAMAIAHDLGIKGKALTGAELDKLNIDDIVEDVSIYARVSPEHKMRITTALKKKGHVVAMTGDGVNDAPALKNADIGIAMGITGTDVSKEASDMILTDDNFTSIVSAVEEGRHIYENIKKFVNYLLSSNFGEVLVIFSAILIGLPLPITAIQILWINLVTDGLPALALGVDSASPNIMKNKPKKNENIITKNTVFDITSIGILMATACIVLFSIYYKTDLIKAQTICFTTLVTLEIVRIYMIRSEYKLKILSNKYLIISVLVSIILQLTVIYSPLNKIFNTVPLGINDWMMIMGATAMVFILGIFSKKIIKTKIFKIY